MFISTARCAPRVCASSQQQQWGVLYTLVLDVYLHICDFFGTFSLISPARPPFARPLAKVDRGRPSGHSRRDWARSVHCAARGVRSKFVSAGSGQDDFLGFFSRRSFAPQVSSICRNVECILAHTYLFESGTACHDSAFPVQRQVWGTLSSMFGRAACRVPCVTRACAVCNAMLFFSKKKKQAAGPSSLVISAISLFDFLDDVVILQSSCYLRLRLTIQGGLM